MRRILALCLAILLVWSLCTGCAMPQQPVEDGPTQERIDAIQRVAEEIVLPIAEAYGIDDMQFVGYETEYFYAVCTFSSDKYAQLSWEEQLGLLTDPVLAVYEEKPFPEDGPIGDKELDLEIISGEDHYTDFTAKGHSELRINGKTYGDMETLYSLTVAQDLADTMARVEDFLETSSDEALLEIQLRRKMNDPGLCSVCGAQYRVNSIPAKMIKEYGYCRSLCRNRLQELTEGLDG